MSRVVVAEKVSEAGLALLRAAGHEVVDLSGTPREKLLEALADADALLVRSATKVDAALLGAAPKLTVVGRAGVGVDNVDVPAASARGVLVLNSPTGNVVSAVEHTFAVLLALLRRIPEASASMAQGRWEKSKFVGTELAGKTVGIVGLGQVGSRVASRARAFEARVLGHDPFLPAEKAQEMGVPLVPLDTLLAQSDVVTLHSTASDKGKPLIGAAELARMKPTAVLVNVARGSLVDRVALAEALQAKRLAGAALDVFDPEPPDPNDPLPKLPNVVATPHLGASTVEAQERVSIQTVEALLEALAGAAYVPAVNNPFRGPKDASGATGWMRLAERTGHFLSAISAGQLSRLAVETWGLPEDLVRPVAVAAVKGAIEAQTPDIVNYVNALHMASHRGLAVSDTRHEEPGNYARSIRVTLTGARFEGERGRDPLHGARRPGRGSRRPAARVPARGNGRLSAQPRRAGRGRRRRHHPGGSGDQHRRLLARARRRVASRGGHRGRHGASSGRPRPAAESSGRRGSPRRHMVSHG